MTAPNGTADDLEAAQAAGWAQYVAAVPIDFYGTRAYNTGDPVYADAVIPASGKAPDGAWIPQRMVTPVGTKKDQAQPYDGSQTVVDPAASTPVTTPAAAPVASSPAVVDTPGA